ncbi:MAG: hypothetical protein ACD_79C00837G0004 [uncultured bacterium]|nr:MAG: hypothetical protein ACD_79C00837G0004 [uncultured bacterium]
MQNKNLIKYLILVAIILINCALIIYLNIRISSAKIKEIQYVPVSSKTVAEPKIGSTAFTDKKTSLKKVKDSEDKEESSIAASSLMDINTASEEELTQLSGVGPKLAQQITIYRKENGSFKNYSDILNVPGIGEKKLAQIKPFIQPLKESSSDSEEKGNPNSEDKYELNITCPKCNVLINSNHARDPHFKPYCPNCLYYLQQEDEKVN